jgi:hypothetical protein
LKKIEENLEKNLPTSENMQQLKRYFEDAKLEVITVIKNQLSDFCEIDHMGKQLSHFIIF